MPPEDIPPDELRALPTTPGSHSPHRYRIDIPAQYGLSACCQVWERRDGRLYCVGTYPAVEA